MNMKITFSNEQYALCIFIIFLMIAKCWTDAIATNGDSSLLYCWMVTDLFYQISILDSIFAIATPVFGKFSFQVFSYILVIKPYWWSNGFYSTYIVHMLKCMNFNIYVSLFNIMRLIMFILLWYHYGY